MEGMPGLTYQRPQLPLVGSRPRHNIKATAKLAQLCRPPPVKRTRDVISVQGSNGQRPPSNDGLCVPRSEAEDMIESRVDQRQRS